MSHSLSPEASSSTQVLKSEQQGTTSQLVSHVSLYVGDSIVDESVRSKLSEAVEELVSVEGRLYGSLNGVLWRNVKRVQDGLKRVRESLEKEGRSDAKDDFSTLDKKRKWIEVGVCVHSRCMCVCLCVHCVCIGLCFTQVRCTCGSILGSRVVSHECTTLYSV